MIGRRLGIWGSALVAVVTLAGCSASVGSDDAKPGVTSSALIESNPKAPFAFPEPVIDNTQKDPYTCEGKLHLVGAGGSTDPVVKGVWASLAECGSDDGDRHGCQNYVALPAQNGTDQNGVVDPNWTPYTHSVSFGATNCGPGNLTCQLEDDFFSIPKAHGFKYDIKRILNGSISCRNVDGRQKCTAATSTHDWMLEGVQRADQNWWTKPWHYQGVPAPWTNLTTGSGIDPWAHPAYGSDRKSLDWLSLWNVAYTYSASGPNAAKTANIESEHHQCAAVFIYDGAGSLALYDFQVAVETHDPIGNPW